MYLCVCTRSSKTILKFRHWRWNPEHRSRRAGAFADGLGSVFVRKGEPLGVRGMVTHGIFGFLRDLTITRSECELLVCMFDSVVLFACLRTCLSVGLLICWFVGLLASCLFVLCWLCWLRFLCMFVWGGVPKDWTNYLICVSFWVTYWWKPIQSYLYSCLILFVSVRWSLRMNTSTSCCWLYPIVFPLASRFGMCVHNLSQFQAAASKSSNNPAIFGCFIHVHSIKMLEMGMVS